MKTTTNWIEDIAKPAYESIECMLDAVAADYERLTELKDEREVYKPEDDMAIVWENEFPEEAEELTALLATVGDCEDEDDAQQRIDEDPLSLRIFGERTDGQWEATSYELLLTTGGPAVRIVGDIDDSEAASAVLEVQDWDKPWTAYHQADSDILLQYASYFCFE